MNVSSVMTKPVISIAPTASLMDAADMMLAHRISGLPVVDPVRGLVGIVSEGDFLHRTELGTQRKRSRWLEFFVSPGRAAEEYVRANGRQVAEVMTTKVATTTPDASLEDVVELMAKRRIKRLPVIENDGLVGIVTRSDLLRAMLSLRPNADGADDKAIQAAITAEIQGQTWSADTAIDVIVHDGAVTLEGAIFDDRERAALRVAAENVPGVKSVTDRLTLLDATLGMGL